MVSYRLFQLEFDTELGRYVRRLVGEYSDEWTALAELRARRLAAPGGQPSYELHPHELEVRHFPRSRTARGGAGRGKGAATSTPPASAPNGAGDGEGSEAAPEGTSRRQKSQVSSEGS
jgi:hypothetical protein